MIFKIEGLSMPFLISVDRVWGLTTIMSLAYSKLLQFKELESSYSV